MAIVKTTKNFQVESFVDQSGLSFIIRRKSNKWIVAKLPFKNNKQIKSDVNNRLKELELANEITQERIKKVKKTSKDIFSFAKKANREFQKWQKPKRKVRKKVVKCKKKVVKRKKRRK